MVHEAIIPAMILGIAVVLVGIFAAGGMDMMSNALSINSLEITQLSVTYFDSENRLVLTVKNTGSSTISNVTAIVYAENSITSNPVIFSEILNESDSQGISEILTLLGTSTPMNVLSDKEVSVSISGITYGGSVVQLDPIILKVK